MSDVLNEYREKYPAYADVSDEDLSQAIHKKYYSDMPVGEFNERIGYKGLEMDGVSFMDAVQAGVQNLGGAGQALKAGVYNVLGNEQAQQAAIEEYDKQQAKVSQLLEGATDWRDIVDSDNVGEGLSRTLDFVKEQFGLNSPQMAAILGGGAAGAAASPYLPHPVATAVSKVGGFTVGATATALPMFTGFNVGRQIDEGSDIDLVKAGAYAVPQALFEGTVARVYSSLGLTQAGKAIFGEASETAVAKAGQKIGELLAVGVPAEVVQQGLERAAADLETRPWESEEALNEYIDTAVAAAATLAPIGGVNVAVDLATSSPSKPSFGPKRKQEEIDAILKEDIDTAEEPKQFIIRTPEEAQQALSSLNFSDSLINSFTPEGQVRAANIIIDRADSNRMKFIQNALPENTSLKRALITSQLRTKPVNTYINSKQEIPSEVLESPEVIEPIALAARQTIEKPKTDISFDLNASTADVVNMGRVRAQKREKLFRESLDPHTKDTIGDQLDVIQADVNEFLKPLAKMNKADLIETAKKKYKLTEDDLKNPMGRILPKPDIIQKISEKRVQDGPVFDPKRVPKELRKKPAQQQQAPQHNRLERVTPSILDGLVGKVAPLKVVAPQSEPVIRQMNKAARDSDVKVDLYENLKLDEATGDFKTPLKAAQSVNFMYTAQNYSNVAEVPVIDSHMQEAWEMYFDTLGESTQKALKADVPALRDAIAESDNIVKQNIQAFSDTDIGKREVLSHSFARFVEADRSGTPLDLKIPKETRKKFQKLVKALKKIESENQNTRKSDFRDMFPEVSLEGLTPRDLIFDSVTDLRHERLKTLSDAIQEDSFAYYRSQDLRPKVDSDFKKYLAKEEAVGRRSPLSLAYWGRQYTLNIGSAKNLAERVPIFGTLFGLKRSQEELQADIMTRVREAGRAWLEEPSQEVRHRAGDVLQQLKSSGQNLRFNDEGHIEFMRDGRIVTIKNPTMIAAIRGLDNMMKETLNVQNNEIRVALNNLMEGVLTKPTKDIKRTIDVMAEDGALTEANAEQARDLLSALEQTEKLAKSVYVPEMRFGNYGFTVHRRKDMGKNGKLKKSKKPVFHTHVESGYFKKKYDKESYQRAMEGLAEYRNNPEYVISEGYELTQNNLTAKLGSDDITIEVLSGLLGSDKSVEYYADVKNWLESQTKYSGFKKHLNESNHIPGFSNDWDRVISSFTGSSAHFHSKARFNPMIQEISRRVETELNDLHAPVKKSIKEYVDYTTDPHDEYQAIRQLNFMWTMGFNMSSGLLQFMTLPTSSVSSMTQYSPNVIKNMGLLSKYTRIAMKEFSKAGVNRFEDGVFIAELDNVDFLNRMKTQHKMDDAQVNFIKEAYRIGKFGATSLEEQAGTRNYSTLGTKGKIRESSRRMTNLAGILISGTEQATRFATLLAHYELFKTNPAAVETALKVLKNDQRFQALREVSGRPLIEDLAMFGMDDAHAIFGKVGRSPIMRNGAGAFLFPFQTYPQQIVEFAFNMYGRGPEGKRALAVMLGSLMMFSGLIGLPGAELAKELAEELYKLTHKEEIDLEYELRRFTTDMTGNARYGQFLTQGIGRALFDLDISKRIGLPIVGQDLILAMLGVRGDMTELAGVQGSMATNAINAMSAYQNDESGVKVASLLTPTAISNLFKAQTYMDEGVKTSRGTSLMSREEVQEDPSIPLLRAIGISSGKIASAREAQYWAQTEDRRIQPKMQSFRKRGTSAMMEFQRAKTPEQRDKSRKKYWKIVEEMTEYLNKKKHPYDIKAFHKTVIDNVSQQLEGGVRLKDVAKATRDDLKSIKEAAGTE